MKGDAYTFAAEVDRQIKSLSSADYHLRRGRAKRLLEELYPLSRYALHLKQPGLSVHVEAFEDDGPIDGRVTGAGYKDFTEDIEITVAYSYKEALRAELLIDQGWVSGEGEITRGPGGSLIAQSGAVDGDHHIHTTAEAVLERLKAKASKGYNPGTVLVIAFDEIKLYGSYWWSLLHREVALRHCAEATLFKRVYLFNRATNELQCAA